MSNLPPPPPPPSSRPVRPPDSASRLGRLSGRTPPNYPNESRWGLGDAWIAFAIFFGASVPVSIIAVLASDDPGTTLEPIWLPVVLAVPALAQFGYVWWTANHKGRGLGTDFAFRAWPSDLAVGAGLFVCGLFLAGFVGLAMDALFDVSPNAAVADVIDESDEPGGGISPWIYLMAVLGATAIPVIEEVVYRGLWWSALEKRGMREEWVLVTTSAIFALAHLEPTRSPILFVLGLALGYGRIRTGRLGPCIAAHIFINSLGMVALLTELS